METLWSIIVKKDHSPADLQRAISNGADVNERNPDNMNKTPLHFCAINELTGDIQVLLDNGADVTIFDDSNLTCINCAHIYKKKRAKEMLVQHMESFGLQGSGGPKHQPAPPMRQQQRDDYSSSSSSSSSSPKSSPKSSPRSPRRSGDSLVPRHAPRLSGGSSEFIPDGKGPGNLQLLAATPTSITVDWSDPVSVLGEQVDGYRYQVNDDSVRFLRANEKPYTVANLAPDSEFGFKIQARSSAGYSAWSDVLTGRTPRGGPAKKTLREHWRSLTRGSSEARLPNPARVRPSDQTETIAVAETPQHRRQPNFTPSHPHHQPPPAQTPAASTYNGVVPTPPGSSRTSVPRRIHQMGVQPSSGQRMSGDSDLDRSRFNPVGPSSGSVSPRQSTYHNPRASTSGGWRRQETVWPLYAKVMAALLAVALIGVGIMFGLHYKDKDPQNVETRIINTVNTTTVVLQVTNVTAANVNTTGTITAGGSLNVANTISSGSLDVVAPGTTFPTSSTSTSSASSSSSTKGNSKRSSSSSSAGVDLGAGTLATPDDLQQRTPLGSVLNQPGTIRSTRVVTLNAYAVQSVQSGGNVLAAGMIESATGFATSGWVDAHNVSVDSDAYIGGNLTVAGRSVWLQSAALNVSGATRFGASVVIDDSVTVPAVETAEISAPDGLSVVGRGVSGVELQALHGDLSASASVGAVHIAAGGDAGLSCGGELSLHADGDAALVSEGGSAWIESRVGDDDDTGMTMTVQQRETAFPEANDAVSTGAGSLFSSSSPSSGFRRNLLVAYFAFDNVGADGQLRDASGFRTIGAVAGTGYELTNVSVMGLALRLLDADVSLSLALPPHAAALHSLSTGIWVRWEGGDMTGATPGNGTSPGWNLVTVYGADASSTAALYIQTDVEGRREARVVFVAVNGAGQSVSVTGPVDIASTEAGEYHQYCGVVSDSDDRIALFVDGVIPALSAERSSGVPSTLSLAAPVRADVGSRLDEIVALPGAVNLTTWPGVLDELRIYGAALSNADIFDVFQYDARPDREVALSLHSAGAGPRALRLLSPLGGMEMRSAAHIDVESGEGFSVHSHGGGFSLEAESGAGTLWAEHLFLRSSMSTSLSSAGEVALSAGGRGSAALQVDTTLDGVTDGDAEVWIASRGADSGGVRVYSEAQSTAAVLVETEREGAGGVVIDADAKVRVYGGQRVGVYGGRDGVAVHGERGVYISGRGSSWQRYEPLADGDVADITLARPSPVMYWISQHCSEALLYWYRQGDASSAMDPMRCGRHSVTYTHAVTVDGDEAVHCCDAPLPALSSLPQVPEMANTSLRLRSESHSPRSAVYVESSNGGVEVAAATGVYIRAGDSEDDGVGVAVSASTGIVHAYSSVEGGVVSADAAAGNISLSARDGISLGTASGDVAVTSGGGGSLSLSASSGGSMHLLVDSTSSNSSSLRLELAGQTSGSLSLSSSATGTQALLLHSTHGGIDIRSSTRIALTSATADVDIDSAADLSLLARQSLTLRSTRRSAFIVDSVGDAEDLEIGVEGSTASRLVLRSSGSGIVDAVHVEASAGGVRVRAAGDVEVRGEIRADLVSPELVRVWSERRFAVSGRLGSSVTVNSTADGENLLLALNTATPTTNSSLHLRSNGVGERAVWIQGTSTGANAGVLVEAASASERSIQLSSPAGGIALTAPVSALAFSSDTLSANTTSSLSLRSGGSVSSSSWILSPDADNIDLRLAVLASANRVSHLILESTTATRGATQLLARGGGASSVEIEGHGDSRRAINLRALGTDGGVYVEAENGGVEVRGGELLFNATVGNVQIDAGDEMYVRSAAGVQVDVVNGRFDVTAAGESSGIMLRGDGVEDELYLETVNDGAIRVAAAAGVNVSAAGGDIDMHSSNDVSLSADRSISLSAAADDVSIAAETTSVALSAGDSISLAADGTSAASLSLSAPNGGINVTVADAVHVVGDTVYAEARDGPLSLRSGGEIALSSFGGGNVSLSTAGGEIYVGAEGASFVSLSRPNVQTYVAGTLRVQQESRFEAPISMADALSLACENDTGSLCVLDVAGEMYVLTRGGESVWEHASGADGQHLRFEVTGSTDSSLSLSSEGTSADAAIEVVAAAGGVNVRAAENVHLTGGASVAMTSETENVAIVAEQGNTTVFAEENVNVGYWRAENRTATNVYLKASEWLSLRSASSLSLWAADSLSVDVGAETAGGIRIGGADTSVAPIYIGTSASARNITLGRLGHSSVRVEGEMYEAETSGALSLRGATGISVQSSAGDVDIATEADSGSVRIATSATARSVWIGADESVYASLRALNISLSAGERVEMNGESAVTVSTAAGPLSLSSTGGPLTLSSTTGSLSLSSVTGMDATVSTGDLSLSAPAGDLVLSSAAVHIDSHVSPLEIGTANVPTSILIGISDSNRSIEIGNLASSNLSLSGERVAVSGGESGMQVAVSGGGDLEVDVESGGMMALRADRIEVGRDGGLEVAIGDGATTERVDIRSGANISLAAVESLALSSAGDVRMYGENGGNIWIASTPESGNLSLATTTPSLSLSPRHVRIGESDATTLALSGTSLALSSSGDALTLMAQSAGAMLSLDGFDGVEIGGDDTLSSSVRIGHGSTGREILVGSSASPRIAMETETLEAVIGTGGANLSTSGSVWVYGAGGVYVDSVAGDIAIGDMENANGTIRVGKGGDGTRRIEIGGGENATAAVQIMSASADISTSTSLSLSSSLSLSLSADGGTGVSIDTTSLVTPVAIANSVTSGPVFLSSGGSSAAISIGSSTTSLLSLSGSGVAISADGTDGMNITAPAGSLALDAQSSLSIAETLASPAATVSIATNALSPRNILIGTVTGGFLQVASSAVDIASGAFGIQISASSTGEVAVTTSGSGGVRITASGTGDVQVGRGGTGNVMIGSGGTGNRNVSIGGDSFAVDVAADHVSLAGDSSLTMSAVDTLALSSSLSLSVDAIGPLTIGSSDGAGEIQVGFGTGRVVKIGNATHTDSVEVGGDSITAAADSDLSLSAGTSLSLSAVDTAEIAGATIGIGRSNAGGEIEIGAAASASLQLLSGDAEIRMAGDAMNVSAAGDLQISADVASMDGDSEVRIGTDAGTASIDIGTSVTARTIAIGSTSSTSLSLAASAVSLASSVAGISVDAATSLSALATTLSLDARTGGSLNIATSSTTTAQVNIGTAGTNRRVTIGHASGGTVAVRAGNMLELEAEVDVVMNATEMVRIDAVDGVEIGGAAPSVDMSAGTSLSFSAPTIDVATTTGDLSLSTTSGDLSLATSTGDITLDAPSVQLGFGSSAATVIGGASAASAAVRADAVTVTGDATVTVRSGTGDLDLDSTSGRIAIGNSIGSNVNDILIGTAASSGREISIGHTSNALFSVASTSISLETDAGRLQLISGGVLTLNATSTFVANSRSGNIEIGTENVVGAIRIGTAGTRAITIGNSAASSVNITASAVQLTSTSGNVRVRSPNGGLDLEVEDDVDIESRSGAIRIGAPGGSHDISIGTTGTGTTIGVGGSNVNTVAIAGHVVQIAGDNSGSVGVAISSADDITINSGGGDISIGNSVGGPGQGVVIGSGGGSIVTIGSTSAASVSVEAVAIDVTAGSGSYAIASANDISLTAQGDVIIEEDGGNIHIGTADSGGDIEIGTDGARTVAIGSSSASSVTMQGTVLTLTAGSSGLTLGGSGDIAIGGDSVDNLQIDIGTDGNNRDIVIGNANTGSSVTIDSESVVVNAGSGALTVDSSSTIDIAAASMIDIDTSEFSINIGTSDHASNEPGLILIGNGDNRVVTLGSRDSPTFTVRDEGETIVNGATMSSTRITRSGIVQVSTGGSAATVLMPSHGAVTSTLVSGTATAGPEGAVVIDGMSFLFSIFSSGGAATTLDPNGSSLQGSATIASGESALFMVRVLASDMEIYRMS